MSTLHSSNLLVLEPLQAAGLPMLDEFGWTPLHESKDRLAINCAIEATCLLDGPTTQTSGITRYTRCLIEEMAALAEHDIHITQLWRSSRWRRRKEVLKGPGISSQMWHRNLWPLKRPYDLVHIANSRIPPWHDQTYVATVHDLYAAIGMNHENSEDRARQMAVYQSFKSRCSQIICISECTRRDLIKHVGVVPERAHTIHLGVSANFRPQSAETIDRVRTQYGLAKPYLLFIGSRRPNKNMTRLLDAFAISEVRHDFCLAVIGSPDQLKEPGLASKIAQMESGGLLKMMGLVGDNDLPAVYAGASAFLLPSLYEGFGLPILEAMACGVPVLTSTAGSCPEVAAGHAVLIDPESIDDIANAMPKVVSRSIEQRTAAKNYAAEKTWRRTAQQTLEVYRLALTSADSI